jgi:hypothetical protein
MWQSIAGKANLSELISKAEKLQKQNELLEKKLEEARSVIEPVANNQYSDIKTLGDLILNQRNWLNENKEEG